LKLKYFFSLNKIFYSVLPFIFSFCTDNNPSGPDGSPRTGDERADKKGITQVFVPAGSFMMGTNDEEVKNIKAENPPTWIIGELPSEQPKHMVQLTSGYWIDKYEVTNEAFDAFVKDSGYYKIQYWSDNGQKWLNTKDKEKLPITLGNEIPNHPRVNVTWYEAEAYANWRGGKLPTEAQWEFAARGRDSLIYPWGNNFDGDKANVVNSTGTTAARNYPGGNSWVGAADMAGNAMEWVQDWLDVNYYKKNINIDPPGPDNGVIKIEKGGWWGSNKFAARSAYRHFEDPPTYCDKHIGFRIVSNN